MAELIKKTWACYTARRAVNGNKAGSIKTMKRVLYVSASVLALGVASPIYAVTGQDPAAIVDTQNIYSNVVRIVRPADPTQGETEPQTICTGLLINARTVVTARHCVGPQNFAENLEEGLKSGKFSIAGVADGITPDEVRQLAGISDAIQVKGGMKSYTTIGSLPDGTLGEVEDWNVKDDVMLLALDKPVDVAASAVLLSPPQGDVLATMVGYGLSGTKEQARELAGINAEESQIFLDALARCGAACQSDPTLGVITANPDYTAEEQARLDVLKQRKSELEATLDETTGSRRSGSNNFHVKTLADLIKENLLPDGGDRPPEEMQAIIDDEPLPYLVADWDPSDPQAGEPDYYPNDTIPNEASAGPGDSGGPLFVNIGAKRFSLGVTHGGDGSPVNLVGGRMQYAAFFNYYRWIVENTPYKYVAAVAGDGKWSDPGHWTQLLDPSWFSLNADGSATNAVPTHDVTRIDGTKDSRDLGHCGVLRGPGSTGFVPNNTDGSHGTEFENCALYFEITLAARGATHLDMDATVDRLAINHTQARLIIEKAHSLTTTLDTRVTNGELSIDGQLKARNLINLSGLVSGKGNILAATFTNSGAIAPGGLGAIGTLSLTGHLVLTPTSALYIDLAGVRSDTLAVTGSATLSGELAVHSNSDLAYGQSFTLLTATNSLTGNFERTSGLSGVLKPALTYDRTSANKSVIMNVTAGQFRDILPAGVSTNMLATADAFDRARVRQYGAMRDFYRQLDVLEGSALIAALRSTQPVAPAAAPAVLYSAGRTSGRIIRDRLSSDLLFGARLGIDASTDGSVRAVDTIQAGASDVTTDNRDLGEGWSTWLSMEREEGEISARQLGGSTGTTKTVSSIAGIEYNGGRWVFGGILGAENSKLFARTLEQSWTREAILVGAQARRRMGDWAAGMWLTRSQGDLDISRTARAGNVRQDLRGTAGTAQWTGGVALSRVPTSFGKLKLTPAASVEFQRVSIDSFKEAGGSAALQTSRLSSDTVTARFGGTAMVDLAESVHPFISLTAVRDIAADEALLEARFLASPASNFRYGAADRDHAIGELQVGAFVRLGDKLFGDLKYQRDLANSDGKNESLSMRVTYRF